MAGCVFVASGLSDFMDIKRVVAASELYGHWTLRTNINQKLGTEVSTPEQSKDFFITLRTNTTHSYRIPNRRPDGKVELIEDDGIWTMIFDPKGRFVKNQLILKNSSNVSITLNIGLDREQMVLWRHLGETGARVDLVFEKKK